MAKTRIFKQVSFLQVVKKHNTRIKKSYTLPKPIILKAITHSVNHSNNILSLTNLFNKLSIKLF